MGTVAIAVTAAAAAAAEIYLNAKHCWHMACGNFNVDCTMLGLCALNNLQT